MQRPEDRARRPRAIAIAAERDQEDAWLDGLVGEGRNGLPHLLVALAAALAWLASRQLALSY